MKIETNKSEDAEIGIKNNNHQYINRAIIVFYSMPFDTFTEERQKSINHNKLQFAALHVSQSRVWRLLTLSGYKNQFC